MLKLWQTADAAADYIESLLDSRDADKGGHDFIIVELVGLCAQMGHQLDSGLRARAQVVVDEFSADDEEVSLTIERRSPLEVRSDRDTVGCADGCEHFETSCLVALLVDVAEDHGELAATGFDLFIEEEVEEVVDELRRRFKRSLRESKAEIEGLPEQIPVFAAVQKLLATL